MLFLFREEEEQRGELNVGSCGGGGWWWPCFVLVAVKS
jgi:hypothetical protein